MTCMCLQVWKFQGVRKQTHSLQIIVPLNQEVVAQERALNYIEINNLTVDQTALYCLCCTQYLKVLVNLVGTHFCVYALFWHAHHIPPMFLRTSAYYLCICLYASQSECTGMASAK